MMKKILASLLAVLTAFGVLMVVAAAEDVVEPVEPLTPAYEPVSYKIEDLIAAADSGKDVYLQPTDIILLPEAPKADESEEPPVEGQVPAGTATDASEAVLIVEYLPGKDAASVNGNDRYVDYDGSGYVICALGDYTDYAYKATERRTDYAIDYVNENEYAFKQWKVHSIYSGPEFSRIVLEAEWDEPVLTGWAGFKAMMRGYIKTIIDYIIEYLKEWLAQLGDFIGS